MKVKQKCVKDICKLILEHPTVIPPDENVSSLLKHFLKEQRTRHVYVANERGTILGTIRLNDLVEFISPYMQNLNDSTFNAFVRELLNKKASDVMLKEYLYLEEETPLTDMVFIMLQNRVNELPVLDKNNKIIGEVNFLEFIKFISDNEHLAEKNLAFTK